MNRLLSRFARQALSFGITLFLGGLFGAMLIRFGPGFDTDERDLDPRYSLETRKAIHAERESETNVFRFYVRYIQHAAHGDWGISRSLGLPVAELVASRAGVTVPLIGLGLLFGWTLGLSLALASAASRNSFVVVAAEIASGLCLSLPAAVVALLIFLVGGPVPLVIGAAIFPRVFRTARDLFARSLDSSQVLAAKARGVANLWILPRYVVRPALAPLVALAGVSVSIAFGAAIPVEVICDLPGVGQLAWKAAMARDLPLLVAITLLVTAVTVAANHTADLILEPAAS